MAILIPGMEWNRAGDITVVSLRVDKHVTPLTSTTGEGVLSVSYPQRRTEKFFIANTHDFKLRGLSGQQRSRAENQIPVLIHCMESGGYRHSALSKIGDRSLRVRFVFMTPYGLVGRFSLKGFVFGSLRHVPDHLMRIFVVVAKSGTRHQLEFY
ncbi:hypothetical protein ABKN59_005677 [Abortiporus biennis]